MLQFFINNNNNNNNRVYNFPSLVYWSLTEVDAIFSGIVISNSNIIGSTIVLNHDSATLNGVNISMTDLATFNDGRPLCDFVGPTNFTFENYSVNNCSKGISEPISLDTGNATFTGSITLLDPYYDLSLMGCPSDGYIYFDNVTLIANGTYLVYAPCVIYYDGVPMNITQPIALTSTSSFPTGWVIFGVCIAILAITLIVSIVAFFVISNRLSKTYSPIE